MELKDRLYVGNALIEILKEQTDKLNDPFDDELPLMTKKALIVQLRMKQFFEKYNEPVEMLEQLQAIDQIVKKMIALQNSK